MARRCRLTSKSILIFVVGTILVAIGNSIQSLTSDECDCLLAAEPYTCNSGSSPTGSPHVINDTSACTYGTDVVSNNCSNGTLHFFGWLNCARFLSVVYWRKTTNGSIEVSIVPSTSIMYHYTMYCSPFQKSEPTCTSNLTVQLSGEPISLICFGFLYDQLQQEKLFNVTIGEYNLSEEGKITLHPALISRSTCPVSTILPDSTPSLHMHSTSYTTILASTISTINIVSSTFVSATSSLGTDSSTSTPSACNCPMNIQQTEPWVHVVYCVIIVIIILISVIVFLLIFIYQQKNRGHYTFHGTSDT